jgi:hypothetical protein
MKSIASNNTVSPQAKFALRRWKNGTPIQSVQVQTVLFQSHRGFSPVSGAANETGNRLNGFQFNANARRRAEATA